MYTYKITFNTKLFCMFFIIFPLLMTGCAWTEKKAVYTTVENKAHTDKDVEEIKVKEFLLSPGDEIEITVYRHEELNRTIKIPPSGIIFYPIIGEVDTNGKNLEKLRDIITEGLSEYKEQTLLPGDEVSIIVFRNEEYNRRFIVPTDGYIIFPHVGAINVESKSIRELSSIITQGISDYIVNPQVMVDILRLNNPARIANPQIGIEVIGFGGQKVFVLGEVNRPGIFFADGHMKLIEAITQAGGPTLNAKQNSILLIRSNTTKPKPELILLDIESTLKGGDMTQNLVLQRGDIIFVPETFIANVDRFFERLKRITSPLLDLTMGYWIGQNIKVGPRRDTRGLAP